MPEEQITFATFYELAEYLCDYGPSTLNGGEALRLMRQSVYEHTETGLSLAVKIVGDDEDTYDPDDVEGAPEIYAISVSGGMEGDPTGSTTENFVLEFPFTREDYDNLMAAADLETEFMLGDREMEDLANTLAGNFSQGLVLCSGKDRCDCPPEPGLWLIEVFFERHGKSYMLTVGKKFYRIVDEEGNDIVEKAVDGNKDYDELAEEIYQEKMKL